MRQGTSRVKVIACSENFFLVPRFWSRFSRFWDILARYTFYMFAVFTVELVLKSVFHANNQPTWSTECKNDQNNQSKNRWLFLIGKNWKYIMNISFIKRCDDMLNWYFLSFILFSKPFGWLLTTRTVIKKN